jgi:tagatose 6-phosphate kinase
MILCIGATPAAQRVMVFRKFLLDEVNRAATTLDGAAGKAVNVAKVLKILGEQPLAIGFLGGDRGRAIGVLLQNREIDSEFIVVPTPTRQCITIIDDTAGTQTELVEESHPVAPETYEALLGIAQRRVGQCRAVIMSGTITPGGPQDFYARCTRLARDAGALSLVDAQGTLLTSSLAERPGLVKPNRKEMAVTFGCDSANQEALLRTMRELCERGAERVVVTGGKEATLAFDGQTFWRISPPDIKPVNPIGSGDAFTAGLAWRLLRGDDLGEACRQATACGAANALTLMPGDLNPEDVERLAGEVQVIKP